MFWMWRAEMKRDFVLLRGFYEKTLLSSYTFHYPKWYISCIFYYFAVCAIAGPVVNISYLGIDLSHSHSDINFYLWFSAELYYMNINSCKCLKIICYMWIKSESYTIFIFEDSRRNMRLKDWTFKHFSRYFNGTFTEFCYSIFIKRDYETRTILYWLFSIGSEESISTALLVSRK